MAHKYTTRPDKNSFLINKQKKEENRIFQVKKYIMGWHLRPWGFFKRKTKKKDQKEHQKNVI
ncbi:hypothetical protein HMPREF9541_00555 [Escherichia coli MS 116-1]|nr:hypothetical protein HMPREF9541_00555 [Escherichia coli MS 116-1]